MFLLTSKFCHQGVVSPYHVAIYMYKIMKNVYKIRLKQIFLLTCSKWQKWQEVSVDIKILSPGICLPMTCCYIHLLNHEKICIKSEVEEIFLYWQQMTKVMRPSCWHQNFRPNGLSAPAQELYTCIKSWKSVHEIRGQSYFLKSCPQGLSPLALGLYIHVWNKTKYHIK